MSPVLILIFIFCYVPMYGLLISFQDWTPGMPFMDFTGQTKWVGLKHFASLFTLEEFPRVLGNTLLISLYKILFYYPVPILLAIMLNEVSHSGFKRTVQTVVYLPHFISWAIVSGLVFDLLSSTGLINTILWRLGGERVNFFVPNCRIRRHKYDVRCR